MARAKEGQCSHQEKARRRKMAKEAKMANFARVLERN
jgi:hypothetical protein